LFIDEVVGMIPRRGSFAHEVMMTLQQNITTDRFKGKLLVILGGFQEHFDELFGMAREFQTRFDRWRVHFPTWTGPMAADAAVAALQKEGFTVPEDAAGELNRLFGRLANLSNWSSAREVYDVAVPAIVKRASMRSAAARRALAADLLPSHEESVSVADVSTVLGDLIVSRSSGSVQLGDYLSQVVDNKGNAVSVETLPQRSNLVALYFSASWCAPCQQFTPLLIKLYQTLNANCTGQAKQLEIILLSKDSSKNDFASYFSGQPWKAAPYQHHGINGLSTVLSLVGIPSLIFLNSFGDVLCKDGVELVRKGEAAVRARFLINTASAPASGPSQPRSASSASHETKVDFSTFAPTGLHQPPAVKVRVHTEIKTQEASGGEYLLLLLLLTVTGSAAYVAAMWGWWYTRRVLIVVAVDGGSGCSLQVAGAAPACFGRVVVFVAAFLYVNLVFCFPPEPTEGGSSWDQELWEALEEVCSELGYSLEQLEALLQSSDFPPKDVLDRAMAKLGARDAESVRDSLRAQKASVLSKVRRSMEEAAREKSEQEQAIQKELKKIGKCCMGFEWLKEPGGWVCAGGSHHVTDAELGLPNC